jgi:hypothetical protein
LDGEQARRLIEQFVHDNWSKVAFSIACLILGAAWGRWQARRLWKRREFTGRLNISLNSLQDGKLLIRTLREDSLEEIFLNSAAVAVVLAAAKKTTEKQPVLPVAKEDAWYVLNSILNAVSEQFAHGLIRRDLGLEVHSARYVLALTYECDGEVRTRKVRAQVMRKDLFENLPETLPGLESPTHRVRFATLQKMAQWRLSHPEHFLEVEICL